MNPVRNLSIRHRMFLVFSVWLSVFIGFGLFAIYEIGQQAEVTRVIYSQPLQVSNAAIEARVDIIKIHRDMKDVMLASNNTEVQSQLVNINANHLRVVENLNIIRDKSTDINIKVAEEELRSNFEDWKQSRQEVVDMVLDGRTEQAIEISNVKNAEYVQQMEKNLDLVDRYARNNAEDLLKEADNLESNQRLTLFITLAFLSIITFIFFALVTGSILRPVSKLKNAMNNSSETGILEMTELQGKNEFSDMALNYNNLVKRLKNQFWMLDGQNWLGRELAGDLSLEQLCRKAIDFLARQTEAANGAIYLADRESSSLILCSAFAQSAHNLPFIRLEPGQGILGQAALEKKAIHLTDINGAQWLVGSGTLEAAPLEVYVYPLLHEDELYGVVELVSFKPFDQSKRDYLEETGKVISVNLFAAVQSNKIKELLLLSESAKKEAEASASKLREANQILEEQQRLMQQQAEELQQTNLQLEEQHQIQQQQSEELFKTNSQLEEQQQKLEEQSLLLNRQNEELEKSREELINRSVELEAASRYKSEFLANMSHELRTPLNSVILLSSLLTRDETIALNPKTREKLEVINKSGNELLRLINEILDLSKIEAGRMDLNITSFFTDDLLMELKQMFSPITKDKGLEFNVEDRCNARLNGDKDKIAQILRNFLSNAIKFTESGSVSLVADYAGKSGEGVIFTVQDTGPGIPVDKMDFIFSAFRQGDGSISRKYGGTGLGLTICRKLAALMNGEINVSSQPGTGSSFSLHLRDNPDLLQDKHFACEEVAVGLESTGESISGLIPESAKEAYKAEVFEKSETIAVDRLSAGKTILVIEDDSQYSDYLRSIIEGIGLSALTAHTGRQGLKFAGSCKVDGILLDLGLPDMNGIEVLKELKSTVELRKIPVHILSVKEHDLKALKMGALGFRQKPLEDEEVKSVINGLVRFAERTPKHLLVIEDDPVQREIISELVGDMDIKVTGVESQAQAEGELTKGDYDAVILDLNLKEGSGYSLLNFISRKALEVPVIVYTGSDLTVDQEKEIRKHADSIIVKTAFSGERLLDEVTLFLHKVRKNNTRDSYLSDTNQMHALKLNDRKIMIVDDDPRNIYVIASALENYGAEIIEAENGQVALEKLENDRPDLILMDIMMPVLDGLNTTKAIRSRPEFKELPIIALTAKTLSGDRERCLEAGANDYISKPVNYDSLIRIVKAWLEK